MQKILGGIQKAVLKYEMISDNDKVAVGVSGGKDSLLLLTALNRLRRYIGIDYKIVAVHIDMGTPGIDKDQFNKFRNYIEGLDIELIIEHTELYDILFNIRREANPCSLCSKIRRGALNTIAIKEGCNKIALGHHADDVMETFLLSLLYEGRLSTFKPVSYMSRSDITLIRPMVLVNEQLILSHSADLPYVDNPCPANKKTQREYMKNLINKLNKDIPRARERIFSALVNPERNSLWDK